MYVCYLTIYNGDKLPPFYIGSTSLNNINKGYKGSVVSIKYGKIFKEELKNNIKLFDVLIISEHKTRVSAMEAELEVQKKMGVVKSDRFINESYASVNGMFGRGVKGDANPMFGKTHTDESKEIMRIKRGHDKRYEPTDEHREICSKTHKGKIVSDETREKISKNRKGKNSGFNHPMYKKKMPFETREKISKANKGRFVSDETREKISKAKKNKVRGKFSDEWKKNISKANKGKIMSDETKKKLIKSKTGMSYKISICPHCGKEGGGGNMKRYHFENCKLKK